MKSALSEIIVEVYGMKRSVLDILTELSDEEIQNIFEPVLESLLQEGR